MARFQTQTLVPAQAYILGAALALCGLVALACTLLAAGLGLLAGFKLLLAGLGCSVLLSGAALIRG